MHTTLLGSFLLTTPLEQNRFNVVNKILENLWLGGKRKPPAANLLAKNRTSYGFVTSYLATALARSCG
jgi:hypothetical protein